MKLPELRAVVRSALAPEFERQGQRFVCCRGGCAVVVDLQKSSFDGLVFVNIAWHLGGGESLPPTHRLDARYRASVFWPEAPRIDIGVLDMPEAQELVVPWFAHTVKPFLVSRCGIEGMRLTVKEYAGLFAPNVQQRLG